MFTESKMRSVFYCRPIFKDLLGYLFVRELLIGNGATDESVSPYSLRAIVQAILHSIDWGGSDN